MFKGILRKKESPQSEETRRSGEDRRQAIQNDENLRKTSERRSLLQYSARLIENYRKIPLLKNLSDEQIVKILRICSKRKYSKSQYVYRRQMNADNLYIVLKGQLNIMLRIDHVWATVKPLNCVGAFEFFTGIPRKTDVFADTETIVLRISGTELNRVMDSDADLRVKILQNVIKDLSSRILSNFDEIEQLHYRIKALDTI